MIEILVGAIALFAVLALVIIYRNKYVQWLERKLAIARKELAVLRKEHQQPWLQGATTEYHLQKRITELETECNRLYGIGQDYDAGVKALEVENEALTLPNHRCEPIAVAQLNDVGGRAHWIGRLLEPIPDYEQETHCMHMKTPLKGEVVFGFILADFHQLAALCEAANGGPINPAWVTTKAMDFINNLEVEWVRSALLTGDEPCTKP